MKKVLFYLLLLAFTSCASQNGNTKVSPDEFEKMINGEKVQILDVRSSGEYMSGHIKNSLQADWRNQGQFIDRTSYLSKEKPVYVYCLSGGRSSAAAEYLRQNGFKKVVELDGGINSWKMMGKATEGSSNEPQITLAQFQSSIPSDKTVLVDFGAVWCPPCVKMEPVLAQLKADKALNFSLLKIDAGIQTELMKSLSVTGIPTFIVFKGGKEVYRKQGLATQQELSAQLK
jgi:rhodanese-related sulfurtransferase